MDSTGLNPAEVGDIVVGTVLAPGSQRAIECRAASFYAGFPGLYSCRRKSCELSYLFQLDLLLENHNSNLKLSSGCG